MRICIVNFSGRQDGNCNDITKFIERELSSKHKVTLFEMCDLNITPCGKCDYECFCVGKSCPCLDDDIYDIYMELCSSDLVYYVIPNYINYPNAYFFIFNERKQGFFAPNSYIDLFGAYMGVAKKFVIVSNTEQDNFKQILMQHVLKDSSVDFLFLATKDLDKGSVGGGITESEQAKMMVRGFVS